MPSPATLTARAATTANSLTLGRGVLLPDIGTAAVSNVDIGPGPVSVAATVAIPTPTAGSANDTVVFIGDILVDELLDTLTTNPAYPVVVPRPAVGITEDATAVAAVTQIPTPTVVVSNFPTTISGNPVSATAAVPSPAINLGYVVRFDGYVELNGTSQYVTSPDHADFPTGDFDIRLKVATTWSGFGTERDLFNKAGALRVTIDGTGFIILRLTQVAGSAAFAMSPLTTFFGSGINGNTYWIRWRRWSSDTFHIRGYTSTDGVSWTQRTQQLGTYPGSPVVDSANQLELGRNGAATYTAGKFYRAQVATDHLGTNVVWNFDAARYAPDSAGKTWTLQGAPFVSSVPLRSAAAVPAATATGNAHVNLVGGTDFQPVAANGKVGTGADGLTISSTNNQTLVTAATINSGAAVPGPASITEGQGASPPVSSVAATTAIPPISPATDSNVDKEATPVTAAAALPVVSPETGGDVNLLRTVTVPGVAVPRPSLASGHGAATLGASAAVPRPRVSSRLTAINDINVVSQIPTPTINNARNVTVAPVAATAAVVKPALGGVLPTWTHFYSANVRTTGLESVVAEVPSG